MITPVNLYSFMEEIYTHITFICAHSQRLRNNLTRHHSDLETGKRCTHLNVHKFNRSAIFWNQIQRACKKKKHKEIIEYRLKLAGLNACTPVCCFEGVIHWRWCNLASTDGKAVFLSDSFCFYDRTNLYVHTVCLSWCFSVNGLWSLISIDVCVCVCVGTQNISAFGC